MKKLAKRSTPLVAVAVLGALLLVAAASGHGNGKASSSAGIKACALLPDTKSSTRYTLFDAPYLKAAFKKAERPGAGPERAQRLAEAEVAGAAVPGQGREGDPARPDQRGLG